MKNKNSKILVLFFFYSSIIFSQIKIYQTFEDYKINKSQEFDELKNYYNFRLYLSKNNKDYKIHCKDIWGFKFKNSLFRVKPVPVKLVSKGKLFYYENGAANIKMLIEESSSAYYRNFFDGSSAYISKDINSTLIPLGGPYDDILTRIRVKKKIKKFKQKYPEFDLFFECLRNNRIETIRRCITNFEKKQT